MPDPTDAPVRRIDCPQQCGIPEGVSLHEVPAPRHRWADVVICPNDGCERAFLVTRGADDA